MTKPKEPCELSETRKADRIEMRKQIEALAAEFGYTCDTTIEDARSFTIHIETLRGLRVYVGLSGASMQPDVHVLPWYIGQGEAKLAAQFGYVGGTVNSYHWGKCTSVSRGAAQLMRDLRLGFQMAKDGTAFQ